MSRQTPTPQGTLIIEQVPVEDLRPDPANPRRISDQELENLTRSLREFGFVQPVLARRKGKVVIGGHQRLLAARKLGHKTVPVIYLSISEEQAQVLNLALNRISGEWDEELLGRLLADLGSVPGLDVSLSGFAQGVEDLGFDHLIAFDHVVGADPENRPPGWRSFFNHKLRIRH